MSEPFRQVLPDLAAYRVELVAAGAPPVLSPVPSVRQGLLAELPAPPSGRSGWPWDRESRALAPMAGDWPTITIVMPSYQQGAYLEEAIRSVLLQNYPRLEFILMDGGSNDESAAVIEKYRPWLSFARSVPDRGQAHAINLGFSLADPTGLRGWLNSDDLYLPGALTRVAEAWGASRADFIYGDAIDFEEASGNRKSARAGIVHERYLKFPGLIYSHAAFWSGTGHVPLWEEQFCALDYELWIRLLPGRRIRHVPWPLGVFRQHEAAKSFSPKLKHRWDEDARRNGLAHPRLYRPNRWLEREHRLVQRLMSPLRKRRADTAFEVVCAECGWSAASP